MRKKCYYIILLLLFMSAIGITVTYSYYLHRESLEGDIDIGDIVSVSTAYQYLNEEQYDNINAEFTGYDALSKTISCYASNRRTTDLIDYIQLNQLKVNVLVQTDIDVMIRVKIQDVWTSSKTYSSNTTKTSIITRNWNEEEIIKPFNFYNDLSVEGDEWIYNPNTGYAYYNLVINASDEVQTIEFMIPSSYLYVFSSTAVGYRETIFVEMNFKVDVVQANRANIIWNN